MPTRNLTDAFLRGLTREHGEIIDLKSGLAARADQAGRVMFSYRYRFGNRRRRLTLGRFPTVSLADARAEAGRIREQVRRGEDPQAERRQARAAPAGLSFNELCERYLELYAEPRKASWRDDAGFLRHARLVWGKREAASIVRQEAARLLFDLASTAPIAANRTRSVLLKMYGWAVDSGLLDINPLHGVRKPGRENSKTRTLSDAEIRLIWRVLDTTTKAEPGTVAALKTLLLLGQRPGEISGMAIGELHHLDDARSAYWELPAERMKARKSHVVPLPRFALDIITAEIARPRAGTSGFVFASKYATRARLSRNSLSETLARLIGDLDDDGPDANVVAGLKSNRPTPHDFRRSVISGMSKLGVSRDDRMAVASHSHGDVHAVYDRYDRLPQKRAALEAWERHVQRVISGETDSGGVVALRRETVRP